LVCRRARRRSFSDWPQRIELELFDCLAAVRAPLTPRRYSPVLVAMGHKSSFSMISIAVTNLPRRILAALALAAFALIAAGCSDQNEATNKLVQQQQEQLEHQQQELEQLQANQNQGYTPGAATAPRGGCDKEVETTATHRGGDKFAAGDFNKALGYYQDALLSCPNDDRAQVNVARTYEALGNKVAAINLYRKVADTADANSATVSDAQDEAKAALLRLQAARMP
jgi:tetratricopeptide (TPR) repeat protein